MLPLVSELNLKVFSDWVPNFKNWQGNWIWLPTDLETPNLTAYMRKVVTRKVKQGVFRLILTKL